MSLQEFWISIRGAAGWIAPSVTADSPRINTAELEDVLRGATLWLTPKSVEGFDPQDFDFLSSDERQALTESVERFREVACPIKPTEPATDRQIEQALPAFTRIVEILGLGSNKYADLDALVLGKRLEQRLALAGRLPSSVRELRFETGEDSSGGQGLWIWVVFEDKVARKDDVLLSHVKHVKRSVDECIKELGIMHWPYVRFRTDADQDPKTWQRVRR